MAIERQVCLCCGKDKRLADYYVSQSPIYKLNKRMPICKICLRKFFEELTKQHSSQELALYELCRILDIYYSEETFKISKTESKKGNANLLGIFLKNTSSMGLNEGKTFKDTIVDKDKLYMMVKNKDVKEVEVDSGSDEIDEDLEYEVSDEIKAFWGFQYSNRECVQLQNYYDDLISAYECKTPIQKNIYKDLAINELKKSQCQSANDYKKYIDVQSNLMNDANIKPIQDKGDDSLSTWGLWVKKIEEEEPIPEASEEFQDVDYIRKYIGGFFIKHMQRILGIGEDDIEEEESRIIAKNFDLESGD